MAAEESSISIAFIGTTEALNSGLKTVKMIRIIA